MTDFENNLNAAFKTFKRNPTATAWQILTVAMFAHQQGKHASRREAPLHELAIDISEADLAQISAAYEKIVAI
jgi:hypothetical protein